MKLVAIIFNLFLFSVISRCTNQKGVNIQDAPLKVEKLLPFCGFELEIADDHKVHEVE
jgi:hypothetical protein